MTTKTAAIELPPLGRAYEPAIAERRWYQFWAENGFFQPRPDGDQPPFVIVMPPPNVTGELHMGHALFATVEDILVRYHRMRGRPSLWLPGSDHAGIAGQVVVERELAKLGLSRHDLGREKFLEHVWEWMDTYQARIREQLTSLGASCDWSRYRFTMDEGPAQAVRTVFKKLYDEGLIYRGERLVSWDPSSQTVLSDLEVVHKNVDGHLWTLRYPLADGSGFVEVATTRPETMLGDTGVAVHPQDERYRHLVGKLVRLPIMGREIPIVADDGVDPAFGSGAVKVTPAHDPLDFEIGRRHDLPTIAVMNFDGTMNEQAGPFAGLTIQEARAAVVERLRDEGALVAVTAHQHSVATSERTGAVIEPMISTQWFVRMKPLAEPAIEVVKNGQVRFVPERYTGIYLNWMENIHDWCISRQLWWGHRIPVWYDLQTGEMYVTDDPRGPEFPPGRSSEDFVQDEDVLDTWFSSGLWPFSMLGWPEQTDDLRRFYPSTVMETGGDIIFFWVARMIFFGLKFMGQPPFDTVYIHGTVRDAEGQRMSKTKGNVLEPTAVAERFGTDALRFTLVTTSGPGTDPKISEDRIEANRNFANKLFNATKFVLGAIDGAQIQRDLDGSPAAPDPKTMRLPDEWIVSRLSRTISEVTRQVEEFQLHEAGRLIYEFLWSEFSDWYIECAKVRLRAGSDPVVRQTLAYVLERSLRLLHPYMPYVTEELWQRVPHGGEALIVAPWPEPGSPYSEAEEQFDVVRDAVRLVRNARAEHQVDPAAWVSAVVYPGELIDVFVETRAEFVALARIQSERLTLQPGIPETVPESVALLTGGVSIFLPMAGLVDLAAERERLTKELAATRDEVERARILLSNEQFVAKAAEKVVAAQRLKLTEAEERARLLENRLADLG
jgi:valyl-tRNA synthetase